MKVFDVKTGKNIRGLIGDDVHDVIFSSDGLLIFVVYENNTSKIFDVETNEELPISLGYSVQRASFSPDGKLIYVKYDNKPSKLFDIKAFAHNPMLQESTRRWGQNAFFGIDLLACMVKDGLIQEDKDFQDWHAFLLDPTEEGIKRWKESAVLGFDFLSWLIRSKLIQEKEDFRNWHSFLLNQVEKINDFTTDYNRPRLLELFRKSDILGFVHEKKGDIKTHLLFYVDVISKNNRLALLILEDLFDGIKKGIGSIELEKGEQKEILNFIKKTNGFNLSLYQIYKNEGEDGLDEIVKFGEEILQDKAGLEELKAFEDEMSDKGYDGEEVLLAVTQKVIPTSGASFVKKDEVKGLFGKYLEAGDRRKDIPKALRNLGRFDGKLLKKMEWKLKKREKFDPEKKFQVLLSKMHYPDSGKDEKQKEKDAKADRDRFVEALKDYFKNKTSSNFTSPSRGEVGRRPGESDKEESSITPHLNPPPQGGRKMKENLSRGAGEVKGRLLNSFLSYARHNDLLKEKVDAIQTESYVSLDLLEQLFTDKDNLSVLLREIIAAEFNNDGSRNITNQKGFLKQINGIWNNAKLTDPKKKEEALQSAMRSYKTDEIVNKVFIEDLDPALEDAINNILSQRSTLPVSPSELIQDLFKEPVSTIKTEKAKYEEVVSEDSVNLKFQVVKGPAYGLWGLLAGVCIAPDVELWKKKGFYLLAMIDETSNEAVGFIHLYTATIKGKKYLTVPGIEPSTEFLGQAKAREIYPLIEEAIAKVAKEGDFEAVYIPTNKIIHSNRGDIQDLIKKQNYKTLKVPRIIKWSVQKPYPFKEVYVMWEKPANSSSANSKLKILRSGPAPSSSIAGKNSKLSLALALITGAIFLTSLFIPGTSEAAIAGIRGLNPGFSPFLLSSISSLIVALAAFPVLGSILTKPLKAKQRIVKDLDNGETAILTHNGAWKVAPYDAPENHENISRPTFDKNGDLTYIAQEGDKYFVVHNGEKGPCYDGIVSGEFLISPDGKPTYIAEDKGKYFVVHGDETGPEYSFRMRDLTFGPNGELAYCATDNAKEFAVLNGVEGPGFGKIHDIVFSPDGTLVYVAVYREKNKWVKSVVHDNVIGTAYEEVSQPVFSPNGDMAYSATLISEHSLARHKEVIVHNGQRAAEYDHVSKPALNSDGKLAYAAGIFTPEKFIEGIKGAYRNRGDSGILRGLSHCLGYTLRRAFDLGIHGTGKTFIINDGVRGPAYDDADSLYFSPDGNLAYRVTNMGKQFIVFGNTQEPEYESVELLPFGPGGELVYIAKNSNGKFLVYGGKKGPAVSSVDYQSLLVTKNGNLVYRARIDKKWTLVIDDFMSPELDAIYYIAIDPTGNKILTSGKLGDRSGLWTFNRLSKEDTAKIFKKENTALNAVPKAAKPRKRKSRIKFSNISLGNTIKKVSNLLPVLILMIIGISCLSLSPQLFLPLGIMGMITLRDKKGRKIFIGKDGNSAWKVETRKRKKRNKHVAIPRGTYGTVRSNDGQVIIHYARQKSKHRVYVNGKPGPWVRELNNLKISPGNTHRVAYQARKDNKWFTVLDGKRIKQEFDELDETGFEFSSDGKHLAFVGINKPREKDRKSYMVFDGKKGPAFHHIRYPVFSPDGKHMAYAAINDTKAGPRFFLVVDGKVIATPYKDIKDLEYSPDSKSFAYEASDGEQSFAIWKDRRIGRKYLRINKIIFSPDSQHIAFEGISTLKSYVVKDGKQDPSCEGVYSIAFSPDSKHFGYIASDGKNNFIVKDGKKKKINLGIVDIEDNLALSPGGKHVAYAIRTEDSPLSVVVDGKKLGFEFRGIDNLDPKPLLRFDADQRLIIEGEDKAWALSHAPMHEFDDLLKEKNNALNKVPKVDKSKRNSKKKVKFMLRNLRSAISSISRKSWLPLILIPVAALLVTIGLPDIAGAVEGISFSPYLFSPFSFIWIAGIVSLGKGGIFENKLILADTDNTHIILSKDRKRSWRAKLYYDKVGRYGDTSDLTLNLTLNSAGKLAYKAKKGGKWVVVYDDNTGPKFDEVRNIAFTPKGSLIYNARKGKKWMVVSDNEPGPEFDKIHERIISPKGNLAYKVKKGNKQLAVLDNAPGTELDEIYELVFSLEGDLAYEARKDGKQFIVCNKKPGPKFKEAHTPIFSPKGELAYIAKKGGKWHVVHNKKTVLSKKSVPKFDEVDNLTFSPDGKLAYTARKGDKWLVVFDGEPGDEFDYAHNIRFNSKGKLAYKAEKGGKQFVVFNNKPGTKFDEVYELVFSPKGKLAYEVRKGKKQFVVFNNKPGTKFDEVYNLAFSPEGNMVYSVRKGKKWFVVLDNKPGLKFDEVYELAFSPKNKLAYTVKKGNKWFVVFGKKPGPKFDEISELEFSPDGKLAYRAREGDKWFMVFGNKPIIEIDEHADMAIDPYDKVIIAANLDGRYRVWALDHLSQNETKKFFEYSTNKLNHVPKAAKSKRNNKKNVKFTLGSFTKTVLDTAKGFVPLVLLAIGAWIVFFGSDISALSQIPPPLDFIAIGAIGIPGSLTKYIKSVKIERKKIKPKTKDIKVTKDSFSPIPDKFTLEEDREAVFHDKKTPFHHKVLKGHKNWVQIASWNPDGKKVMSGSHDRTLRVWDLEEERAWILKGHDGWLDHASWSPDGTKIASVADGENDIRVWDLSLKHGQNEVVILKGHKTFADFVCFSPDGKMLVSIGLGGEIRVWNLETKEVIVLPNFTNRPIHYASFSPDSKKIAIAGDSKVYVWKIGEENVQVLQGHKLKLGDWIHSVFFDSTGKSIISASTNGSLRIWDLENKEALIYKDKKGIYFASLSPDKKQVVFASGNSKASILDLETKRMLTLPYDDITNSAFFSPDGKQVLLASAERAVWIWDVPDIKNYGIELLNKNKALNKVPQVDKSKRKIRKKVKFTLKNAFSFIKENASSRAMLTISIITAGILSYWLGSGESRLALGDISFSGPMILAGIVSLKSSFGKSSIRTKKKDGGHVTLSKDGKSGFSAKPLDAISFKSGWIADIAISNQGKIAYTVTKGDKSFVVFNGKTGPKYDEVHPLVFTPDGNLIYEAKNTVMIPTPHSTIWNAVEDNTHFVVFNNKPATGFDDIGGYDFTNDGKFAYSAKKGNMRHVIQDGKLGPGFDDVSGLEFSPDGKLAYEVKKDGKWFWVYDGSFVGEVKDVTKFFNVFYDESESEIDAESDVVFSPEGESAHIERKGDKKFVVRNDKPEPAYDDIEDIAFSPGGRLAYKARSGEKWLVVLNNKPSAEFDKVYDLAFGPDDKLLYRASTYAKQGNDKWFAVLENEHIFEIAEDSIIVPGLDGKLIVSTQLNGKNGIWTIAPLSQKELAKFIKEKSGGLNKVPKAAKPKSKRKAKVKFDFLLSSLFGKIIPIFVLAITAGIFWFSGSSSELFALNGLGPLGPPDLMGLFAVGSIALSPIPGTIKDSDGSYVMPSESEKGGWRIRPLDKNSGRYDEISVISVSKQGKLACRARKGKKWFVVIDGEDGPRYDSVYIIGFTEDGKLVYKARKGKKEFVVVDGNPGKKYDLVHSITLSNDNKLAYIARKGKKWFVVLDGQPGVKYDAVENILFNHKNELLYIAKDNDSWFLVTGDKPGTRYDHIIYSLIISPQGEPAYEADINGKNFVIYKDQAGPMYNAISNMTFTKDGELAYVARKGDKSFVVFNGEPGLKYDHITSFLMAPDNKPVYVTVKNERWRLVHGDQKGPEYDLIHTPFLTSSGEVAYPANKGNKWHLVSGNTPGHGYDQIIPSRVSVNNKLAYNARLGSEWFVIIDDKPGPKSSHVSLPLLDPKGKPYHIAHDGKKWFVFSDTKMGLGFDTIPSLVFTPESAPVISGSINGEFGVWTMDALSENEISEIFKDKSRQLNHVPRVDKSKRKNRKKIKFGLNSTVSTLLGKAKSILPVALFAVLGWIMFHSFGTGNEASALMGIPFVPMVSSVKPSSLKERILLKKQEGIFLGDDGSMLMIEEIKSKSIAKTMSAQEQASFFKEPMRRGERRTIKSPDGKKSVEIRKERDLGNFWLYVDGKRISKAYEDTGYPIYS
ncbi:hypothetical protein ACFL6Y_09870, partial [Elusimicrobiota bacterium]